MTTVNSKVPKVPPPEHVKKAQLSKEERDASKKAKAVKRHAKDAVRRREILKRCVHYEREYKAQKTAQKDLRAKAKKEGSYFVEAEPKLGFVIRIRGIRKVPPKPRKTLQLLRLRQVFNGVFVKLTKPMKEMLRTAEPYITWGYPTLATVRKLLYKRGHLRIRKQRKRIQSNAQIAKKLKKHNVLCIEDLVHEIFTTGKNFKSVNKGLWHFKLSPPRGGMRAKRKHFVDGGDAGNREKHLNSLVRRMV